MTTPVHPVDQILPARAMVSLGFQHMLVSYLGAIAVPMIVAGALKMTPAQTTLLISTAPPSAKEATPQHSFLMKG